MGTENLSYAWYDQPSLMHEMIGLSPMESIVAATQSAAIALGIADDTGTLQPGKQADLLVVDGDPLADLTILEDRQKLLGIFQGGELKIDRGLAVLHSAVPV